MLRNDKFTQKLTWMTGIVILLALILTQPLWADKKKLPEFVPIEINNKDPFFCQEFPSPDQCEKKILDDARKVARNKAKIKARERVRKSLHTDFSECFQCGNKWIDKVTVRLQKESETIKEEWKGNSYTLISYKARFSISLPDQLKECISKCNNGNRGNRGHGLRSTTKSRPNCRFRCDCDLFESMPDLPMDHQTQKCKECCQQ